MHTCELCLLSPLWCVCVAMCVPRTGACRAVWCLAWRVPPLVVVVARAHYMYTVHTGDGPSHWTTAGCTAHSAPTTTVGTAGLSVSTAAGQGAVAGMRLHCASWCVLCDRPVAPVEGAGRGARL